MALTQYRFQRGEPIVLGDRVESGTVEGGHSMRARMKPVPRNARDEMPGDSVATTSPAFTSTLTPVDGETAAFWLHSLTAAQSLEIAAGEYLFDSSLLLDGTVLQTSDPVRVIVTEAASAAA